MVHALHFWSLQKWHQSIYNYTCIHKGFETKICRCFQHLKKSLVYTYDASISISTRNLRVNRCDASTSALCLCLCRPGLHVRRNDASISTSTREWNDFHYLVLVLELASLRRTCKLGRRKHKHKRKERKLRPPCWNQISRQKAAQLRYRAKFLCFCACVCHPMLMLIARINILVLMLVLMLMHQSIPAVPIRPPPPPRAIVGHFPKLSIPGVGH